MAAEIHVGDVGTIFRCVIVEPDPAQPTNPNAKVPVPLGDATSLEIHFRQPGADGPVHVVPAVLTTPGGADGAIQYVSEPGFLSEAGTWKIQGRIVKPDGTFHSEVDTFEARPNLTDELVALVLHPAPVVVSVAVPGVVLS